MRLKKRKRKTREHQYNRFIKSKPYFNHNKLGLSVDFAYENDPIRLTFSTSRYKFVSKMFKGFNNVLEIGCGDGFFSRIVKQNVKNLVATDFDDMFIENAKENYISTKKKWRIQFKVLDILKEKFHSKFDGIYALDVFEHIKKNKERLFLKNISISLKKNGVLILGIPSLESQKYASKISKEGHVNCKSADEFSKILGKYFNNVFMFSMNDEVIHTGFGKMAHYLIAICCYKK